MPTIVWLDDIATIDGPRVGSKASNLAKVKRLGLSVPDGFCITTEAYAEFVQQNHLQPVIDSVLASANRLGQAALSSAEEAFRGGQMPADVRTDLLRAYSQLATETALERPVAVRSSASVEDLTAISSAGQHATLLNVRGETQLIAAVIGCWASLWSQRAVLYRARIGLLPVPAMAVLVQTMVDAESAGVAFSLDPVTGLDHMVIEASWGQGEAVVSGQIQPDRYAVARDSLEELSPPRMGDKARRMVMGESGGLTVVPVSAEDRRRRVLSRQRVRDIGEVVLNLERHLGGPQDIEWALCQERLFVLQSRPITVSGASFFNTPLADDSWVWTASFLNERFPVPVSPLGWTLVNELLEKFAFRDPLRYLGLPAAEALAITRLYRGHPYVNMFVFQTLYKVFPEWLLPEDAYHYFPAGKTELRRAVAYPRSLLDPRFAWSMAHHLLWRPAVWSPWHNHHVWSDFVKQHEQCNGELEQSYAELVQTGASPGEVWALIRNAQALNAGLLAIHRWTLTCTDLIYSLLRRMARIWGGSQATVLCTTLVAGLPNRSAEADRALHDLASKEEGDPAYVKELDDFLKAFGHRSFYLDIYHPPLGARPSQVTELVRGIRQQCSRAPAGRADSHKVALDELRARVRRGPVGTLKWALLSHLLGLTRRYMPLREEQRFHWQKTLALMRRLFLVLGEQMTEAGALTERESIFFLRKDEVENWAQGMAGTDLAALAGMRRVEFERLCRESRVAPDTAYPPFLQGNSAMETVRAASPKGLQGHGVSPGLAVGRVLILHSADELGRVKAGDVLVAPGVDSGWTPVFGLLKALVLEHGGQLSHAAVIAREYGLPAVTGVEGITSVLHDGEEILVDGLSGLITRLKDQDVS